MNELTLKTKVTALCGVAVVSVMVAASSWAQDLKGLTGIRVEVAKIDPDAEKEGLAKATLQADVEQKLRQAGLPVVTGAGDVSSVLSVSVKLYKKPLSEIFGTNAPPGGLYAFCLGLELYESVMVPRPPGGSTAHIAVTWGTQQIGLVGTGRLRELRQVVGEHVDRFIIAYLAANPKQ